MEQHNGLNNEREWGFHDYLSLAIRRKWIIFSVFILIFSVSTAYFVSRPPVYRAASTFIIEGSDKNSMGGMGAFMFESNARPFGFYKILLDSKRYRANLIEAARQDSILASMAEFPAQLGPALKSLTLAETDYEKLYALKIEANDPVIAYRLAAIVIDQFKRRCQEIELEESRNIVSYVHVQIEQARGSLAEAERELQEFKEKTRITDLDQADGGVLSKLAEIESQLEEVQTKRQLAQANLSAYKIRVSEFRNFDSDVQKRPEDSYIVKKLQADVERLEAERDKFSKSESVSEHLLVRLDAKIRDKKVELRNAVLDAGSGPSSSELEDQESSKDIFHEKVVTEELDLYALQNQETYLKSLIEKYRLDHPNLLEHTIQLAELQRTKTVNENLYTFLVEKAEEAKINAATGTGGIRIVDEPSLPENPISNNMKRNLAVAIILALGLGFGLAFAIDFFDNSIYTPEDLKQLGDLTMLGTIPLMKKKEAETLSIKRQPSGAEAKKSKEFLVMEDRMNGYKDKVISLLQSKEPVVDAYRHVRTNLQFSNIDTSLRRIMVTSSIPGEGKTLTAANLAISFAELGKKVLVVDCDMRRAHQHILFNSRKSPGLSDYLGRDISVEKAIYMTHVPNLYVIPAGTTPPNPAEMLASNKMSELIKKLEQNFDFIIYDTPPIIAVTDPILLSKRVGNVVLVVRFGKTNRHLVSDSLNRLKNVNSQSLGVVLNGMQKAKGYGYYKYDYAYYQTSYYEEDVTPKKRFSLVN